MEPLPQRLTKEKGKNRLSTFASCLLPLSLCLAGYASSGRLAAKSDAPPVGNACQVVATWNHQVVVTPDPAHGGALIPGIAGRFYLFGPDSGSPLAGDGAAVTVDLYDDSHKAAGKAPVLLEEWRIDKDTLKRLLRPDPIGWGYTLFLPWGTYKPEIREIHLALRYQPAQGTPLYAPASSLSLDHAACAGLIASTTVVDRTTPPERAPVVLQASGRETPSGH